LLQAYGVRRTEYVGGFLVRSIDLAPPQQQDRRSGGCKGDTEMTQPSSTPAAPYQVLRPEKPIKTNYSTEPPYLLVLHINADEV
jgi:hypothetical protein